MNVHARLATVARRALVLGLMLLTGACTSAGSGGLSGQPVTSRGPLPAAPVDSVSGVSPAAVDAGCQLDDYGVQRLDLTAMTVGYARSGAGPTAAQAAQESSVREAARAAGVKRLIVSDAHGSGIQQVSDIERLVEQGAQVVLVAPVRSSGLKPALEAAAARGVPVVGIGGRLEGVPCRDYLTVVGSGPLSQGDRAADALIKSSGGAGRLALLLAIPSDTTSVLRTEALTARLQAEAPDLSIVARGGVRAGGGADQAEQAMTQLLGGDPKPDVVYAENDELTIAALGAVQAAGLVPGVDVRVVGVGGSREVLAAVADGRLSALVEAEPRVGPLVFRTVADFYAGQAIPSNVLVEEAVYAGALPDDVLAGAYGAPAAR